MESKRRFPKLLSRKVAPGLLAMAVAPSLLLFTLTGHASPAAKLGVMPTKGTPIVNPYVSPWSQVKDPTAGSPQVIGGAAFGCVSGARALPETGPGYVSIRRERNRYYSHPETLKLVKDLGELQAKRSNKLLMVGDLSQPRGGLMGSMHRSHQNGVDVDVWFTFVNDPKQAKAVAPEGNDPPSMVNVATRGLSQYWGDDQLILLKSAAERPDVDRIFVNFAIKNALCKNYQGDRSWLGKVRPWWGHDAHFHVRIKCPSGSPDCKQQRELPAGDGCGNEVASWMRKAPIVIKPSHKPAPPPPLGSAQCVALLRSGGKANTLATVAK